MTLLARKNGEKDFKEVVEVKDAPESGSDPEQIEVTTLKRKRKSYVEGREDSSIQNFTFNYTEENYFERVLPYCDGKIHEFMLVYQDKTSTIIEGSARTHKSSVALNSAVEAILSITPQDIHDKTSAETEALCPNIDEIMK